jgi:putative ABC transport system permease protein
LGFDPGNVLTMQLHLRGSKYHAREPSRQFYRQLIERLEAHPGVEAVSGVLVRPLEGQTGFDLPLILEGQSEADARKNPVPNFEAVTPHYFRTFKLPLRAGREFTDFDTEQSEPIAIVSESLARTLFPRMDPIGKRFKLDANPWRTIVGVVGNTRYRALHDVSADVYIPFEQWPNAFLEHIAVRTTAEPASLLPVVRREVATLDSSQAVAHVATMEELVAAKLAQPRFSALLLNWLSVGALMLAAVGIYGVLAYSVAQRTREFGSRIALGARGVDILRLVITQGMRLVGLGLVLGLSASLGLTRLLANLLFGVSATDPATFATIVLVLGSVSLLACYVPARRATKVDPLIALRSD